MNISLALKSITDDNKLLIAKDFFGNVYIPQYNINTIGNMIIGRGYLIYLTDNFDFKYPDN